MYSLEYMPDALQDVTDIAAYIRGVLGSPAAADRLVQDLVDRCESLPVFPYAYPVHIPRRPKKFKYRKTVVRNFIILYRVDDKKKRVTIYRISYAKRDWETLLR